MKTSNTKVRTTNPITMMIFSPRLVESWWWILMLPPFAQHSCPTCRPPHPRRLAGLNAGQLSDRSQKLFVSWLTHPYRDGASYWEGAQKWSVQHDQVAVPWRPHLACK
jgi:hypothetical protein